MKYCSLCGAGVDLVVPPGDHLERHVCLACGQIHYQNPKVVAGAIVEHQGQLLLCRRAIEPRYGLWTIPAGFMENGETIAEAALRETWEEAQARVALSGLYGLYSLPFASQVYVIYRGELVDDGKSIPFFPGPESLEVELVDPEEIPWEELAFSVVESALRHYCDKSNSGDLSIHEAVITSPRSSNRPGD